MGKRIWIGGTIIAVVVMVSALMFLGIIGIPFGKPLPKCAIDTVYYEQEYFDEYGFYERPNMNGCSCTGDSEWIEEVRAYGWLCIPIDNTRPDCINILYESTLDCNCKPPNVWTESGDYWRCK